MLETVISEDDPLKDLENKETSKVVHQLVEIFPIQYRSVITLYHINDFNYEEIAKITGMPDGTVKNYLFRGRKILKDLLKKNHVFCLI
ncbi:MAG: sigma-70 family RNA polymerase sigma factor [Cyclobacteriaceae bacterium]|nr:sigma-70 family RNA polymerase sigma factor [Cyclobacteriaceae bacterium]